MRPGAAQTPEQFRAELQQLFPEFQCDLEGEDLTFHAMLMDFTPFFGRHASGCSQKQLKALAAIINAAAQSPGPLENAFDTCFFEGLRRAPAATLLKPFLSATVKRGSHA
jgi:hypothetical protein